jgi:hypothetical protein
MNLNENEIVQLFCNYLKENEKLEQITIRNCGMMAKYLCEIASSLRSCEKLRSIDLSGNN